MVPKFSDIVRAHPGEAGKELKKVLIAHNLDLKSAAMTMGASYQLMTRWVVALKLKPWLKEKRLQRQKAIRTGDKRHIPVAHTWKHKDRTDPLHKSTCDEQTSHVVADPHTEK